jgi:hypothetical protein
MLPSAELSLLPLRFDSWFVALVSGSISVTVRVDGGGAGEGGGIVVATSRRGDTAMTERVVRHTNDRAAACEHDIHARGSDFERLRIENSQLRELVAYLTSLLVKSLVDRR